MLGILLGPGVFGRLSPQRYQQVFITLPQAYEQRKNFVEDKLVPAQVRRIERLMRAEATGVTETYLQELAQAPPDPAVEAEAREIHRLLLAAHRHQGRLLALVGVALVLMVLESVLPAQRWRARRNLATARYAALALWLALIVAQPRNLADLPPLFTLLALGVALLAALVPLGRGRKERAA